MQCCSIYAYYDFRLFDFRRKTRIKFFQERYLLRVSDTGVYVVLTIYLYSIIILCLHSTVM